LIILAKDESKKNHFIKVLIDDEDIGFVENTIWYVCSNGYVSCRVYKGVVDGKIKRKRFLLHRLIVKAKQGEIVDHVSGNKLDNRKLNLRFVTASQSRANIATTVINKSGFKGVIYYPSKKLYKAQVVKDCRQHYLGYYKNPIDAAKAYNKKALELFGEFARLNIIPGENAN